ncbi:MAG: HAMP domain-containing histidine kinase [Actinobacteria bacterium]|nr:HAMP domain-containing histidine kinase [Actinomycetota bacterium]MBI3688801.1 HAMP domain-containing histidine kinase [Actinomycetota bacterium]
MVTARAMLATVDSSALRTGQEVADLVTAGRLPNPLPVAGSATASVQVVDGDGFVRAASPVADHLVPLLDPAQTRAVRAGARLFLAGDQAGLVGPVRVVGVPADTDQQPRTVIVAVSVEQLRRAIRLVTIGLAVGGPLLLAVVTLVAWHVIGSTLRPVAALRRGAEEITGGDGGRRLPLPGARDEIRRLAETLNGMLARIADSRRQQRVFVSDAAHELRSPLASIRTQLEVARRVGDLGAGSDHVVDEVLLDVERLSRLVDDLLALARLDEGQPSGRPRQVIDLAAEVVAVVERYAGARVPVRGVVEAPSVPVLADPDGVRRLLTNLVDNAVRHARTEVRVEVRGDGGTAVLTVSDDGAGVPEVDRERVFDRFARRDDARDRDGGGAGLGLPIARALARSHGGDVTLTESDAGGLAAVVRLPLITGGVPRMVTCRC